MLFADPQPAPVWGAPKWLDSWQDQPKIPDRRHPRDPYRQPKTIPSQVLENRIHDLEIYNRALQDDIRQFKAQMLAEIDALMIIIQDLKDSLALATIEKEYP